MAEEKTPEEKAAAEKAAADKAAEIKAAADKVVKDELAKTAAAEKAAAKEKEGSPLEEAKETLKKLEEQNKIMTGNIEKATKLQAEIMISGKTPAGQSEMTDEEKAEADARKLIEGSGFEDRIFPKKK